MEIWPRPPMPSGSEAEKRGEAQDGGFPRPLLGEGGSSKAEAKPQPQEGGVVSTLALLPI